MSTVRTVIISPSEGLLQTIHPVHIALVIVPMDRDISVSVENAVVLRVLTFNGGSDKTRAQSFTFVPGVRVFYSKSVASAALHPTAETVSQMLKPLQFAQLRSDLAWAIFPHVSRNDGTSLAFNESGKGRQLGLAATCDGDLKPCAVLGPLKHKHGVYMATRFELQACVVPESTREFDRLGRQDVDGFILDGPIEFTAPGEDVELWLHTSESGGHSLTHSPEFGRFDASDTPFTNSSEETLIPESDVEDGDDSPAQESSGFIQTVEFGEKEISLAQVERIVMQALARNNMLGARMPFA